MMHSSVPPLDALRAFEAAARTGSFTAAAEDMNLSHGAVSRQIAKLERWLGQKVFVRQARGVALTPPGQRLLVRTREAFSLISDAADRWTEPQGGAVVKLDSTSSVVALWLIPRFTALETGEPHLRLRVSASHQLVDLQAEGIDLAIRCGRGRVPGRISLRLFEEQCQPIASPELARRVGDGGAERLLSMPLIHDSDGAGWRVWFAAQGLDYRPRAQDRRFQDYSLVLEAAAAGLGIALSRPPLAQALIEAGRLTVVDPLRVLNPASYWLDRPPGTMRPAAQALAARIWAAAGNAPDDLRPFLRGQA